MFVKMEAMVEVRAVAPDPDQLVPQGWQRHETDEAESSTITSTDKVEFIITEKLNPRGKQGGVPTTGLTVVASTTVILYIKKMKSRGTKSLCPLLSWKLVILYLASRSSWVPRRATAQGKERPLRVHKGLSQHSPRKNQKAMVSPFVLEETPRSQ